ncbi:subtilisin-like protein [Lactarius hatsudake]|nr:subtilisin-like protein [Lactarius hatsudake]
MRCHLISVLFVLAASLLGSLAKPFSPRWHDMRIKHSWNTVPENWESLGNPLSGTTIDLYVALKAHRENALIDTLHQVAELVSPPSGTLELVSSWLEHHGIPSSSVSMTHGGTTLTLSGVSIIQANALLGASYQLYRHVETNETVVRTVGYALPAALHRLVQTWQSPRKRPGGATAGLKKPVSGEPVTVLSSRDDDLATPSFLRSLYKTTEYRPAAADRNVLGIFGMQNEYPSPEDLATFMSYTVPTGLMRHSSSYQNGESNLDTQYAAAMTYPTQVFFYSVGQGRTGTDDWLASWFRYLRTASNIPRTISISYVVDERFIPVDYATYICTQFSILSILGVSVLISTGDDGVGKGDCMTNDGTVRFYSNFPATSREKYRTSHSPHQVPYHSRRWNDESRSRDRSKPLRGGFSNIFKRPDYQEQAVTEFLHHLGNQYQGKYNATSRGIPDISAQALNFPVFIKGQKVIAYGTSGSAPVRPHSASLPLAVRYWHEWPHWTSQSGSNPGCNTDGFSAIEGWVLSQVLERPDFQRLLAILPGRVVRANCMNRQACVIACKHSENIFRSIYGSRSSPHGARTGELSTANKR